MVLHLSQSIESKIGHLSWALFFKGDQSLVDDLLKVSDKKYGFSYNVGLFNLAGG